MAIAAKNIVAELNKDENLNGNNYKIWSMKIQYVIEEQEALEVLNKDGNIGFDEYIGTWILRIYRWIFLHEYRYIEN